MIVKNPTDSDVKIQIDGIFYEVGANDELGGVKPDHAAHWKGVHQFLSVQEEDSTTSKDALQETTEEDIEEVKETETEEVVEEEAVEDEKETSSKNKKDK